MNGCHPTFVFEFVRGKADKVAPKVFAVGEMPSSSSLSFFLRALFLPFSFVLQILEISLLLSSGRY